MIQVFGHPRSGTHYTAALIDANLFDGINYLTHYARKSPHALGKRIVPVLEKTKDMLCVYVKRNFDDVSKSVFTARDRFGLDVDDYEDFLTKTYSSIWTTNKKFTIKVNTLNRVKHVSKVSGQFAKIDMTPKEYWSYHIAGWEQVQSQYPSRVLIVNYDELKSNFTYAMSRLTSWIKNNMSRSGISESDIGIIKPLNYYKNINEQVGWIPEG